MAESKRPGRVSAPAAPAVVPPPARPDPGGQLEELNDQLARFLQHADQLVEEWARFGADVRRTVDGEVARIDQAVADAAERALRDAGAQIDRLAAERIEKTVEHAVARWRGEPERAAKLATSGGGTSASAVAAPAGVGRGLVAAVVLANLLLVVLLVVTLRRGQPPPAPASVTGSGSGGVTVIAPEVLAACDELTGGAWSLDDAALVMRAGTAVCGGDEAAVGAAITAHFVAPAPPVDAGPVDGPPPDAKKPRTR